MRLYFGWDDKDLLKAEERIIMDTSLQKNNSYTREHHYYSGTRVAKLFTSEKSRDLTNDPIYKAINQSLNGLIYFRHHSPTKVDKTPVRQTLCYPVILLNNFDKIFRVNIGETNYTKLSDKFFQLEVNYAYLDAGRHRSEYFLIDVVDFTVLDNFLGEVLESDVKLMLP